MLVRQAAQPQLWLVAQLGRQAAADAVADQQQVVRRQRRVGLFGIQQDAALAGQAALHDLQAQRLRVEQENALATQAGWRGSRLLGLAGQG